MIEPQVRGMLKQSFLTAVNSPGPILNLSAAGSVWAGTGLGFHPWFVCTESGALDCPQKDVLGLHFVRTAIRGALLCFRAMMAGDLLRERRFHAASTAMYYTSAFHGLDGFLASRGRVLIQPVRGKARNQESSSSSLLSHDPLPNNPLVICASVTRKGGWSFEPRRRGHTARWAELKQLVSMKGSTLPSSVLNALAYASMREKTDDLNLLLSDGIPALAGLRHQALYEGFGYDDDAYDALVNRVNPYGVGLDGRNEALRELSLGLLDASLVVAEFFFNWCDECKGSSDLTALVQRVAVSTFHPAFEFDLARPDDIPNSINQRVQGMVDRLEPSFNTNN